MTMGPIPSISNLVQRRAVANRAGRARMRPHAPESLGPRGGKGHPQPALYHMGRARLRMVMKRGLM